MDRFIENYEGEKFDVLVIGGGITGASVAYEAAARGLKTALLEKKDFSWATSAVTSKLIHGGLRYLANGEIGLVRESLRERRVLENIAPNFVYPMPILMTHYKKPLKNRKWVVKAGMLIYDLLSYDKKSTWDAGKRIPSHKTISRRAVMEDERNVRIDGLTGASLFYDCISIFPERLTLAFIKSAVACGAKVSNYVKVEGFLNDDKKNILGVKVKDLLCNKEKKIFASVTVNCAGPWADILTGLAKTNSSNGTSLRRSEGIHIITKKKLLSGKYVVASMTPAGRHFFLIPWRGHTIIGTTDKPFVGDPDAYCVTKTSILELIDDVNSSFGDGKLCFADVVHAYGGLRPLVEEQTEETYSSSRRYEILDNKESGLDGLITVEGGKYTTSRNLAEKCVDLVDAKLSRPRVKSKTAKRHLTGCGIENLSNFLNEIHKHSKNGFGFATLDYLARCYGTDCSQVTNLAHGNSALSESLNDDGEILAQVIYAVREEMARTLPDIVLRRTGIGTLGNPGESILRKVAAVAAEELHWSPEKTEKEISEMINMLKLPEV